MEPWTGWPRREGGWRRPWRWRASSWRTARSPCGWPSAPWTEARASRWPRASITSGDATRAPYPPRIDWRRSRPFSRSAIRSTGDVDGAPGLHPKEVRMVTLGMLWMPILLAAIVVFFASFLMWMVLPHHRTDFKRFPDEAAVAQVLRKQSLAPMQYTIPHCGSPKDMKDPAFIKKLEEGPVATLTVMPSGQPSMGKAMALSFLWNLVVSVLVACGAARALPSGSEY